jgi:hypothetical protein
MIPTLKLKHHQILLSQVYCMMTPRARHYHPPSTILLLCIHPSIIHLPPNRPAHRLAWVPVLPSTIVSSHFTSSFSSRASTELRACNRFDTFSLFSHRSVLTAKPTNRAGCTRRLSRALSPPQHLHQPSRSISKTVEHIQHTHPHSLHVRYISVQVSCIYTQ